MANPNPNTDNLKPFKKGQSGNPNGRPKLPDISEAMAKLLAGNDDGKTELEKVLNALKARALKGDVRAVQELLDRAYGKSNQTINHNLNDSRLEIQIVENTDKQNIQGTKG